MGLWAFFKRVFGGAPESKPDDSTAEIRDLVEQLRAQLKDGEVRTRQFNEKMASINIAKPVERFKMVPSVPPVDPREPWNPDYDSRFRFHRDGDHWIWDGAFANKHSKKHGRVPTIRVKNPDGTLGAETTAARYAYERTFNVVMDRGQGRVSRTCGVADCVNPAHMALHIKDSPDAHPAAPVEERENRPLPVQTEIKLRPRTTMSAVLREARQKITEESGGCLRWNGAFTPPHSDGAPRHAVMGFNGKVFRIRRIMYMVAHGLTFSTKSMVPKYVTASCGNEWCVAPRHMRGWTQEEKDAAAARARTGLKWHKDDDGHGGQNGDVPVVRVPEGKHRPVTVIAGVGVLDRKKT